MGGNQFLSCTVNTIKHMLVGVLSTLNNPTLPFVLAGFMYEMTCTTSPFCSMNESNPRRICTSGTREPVARFSKIPVLSLHAFQRCPPFYFVENHNGDKCLRMIERLGLDCLVNAGTPRKLSARILNGVKHGAINVHPGILPGYRGCSCVEWAIYNDDKVGNTAHFMTEEYDQGPIIMSEWYKFPKNIDYQSIRVRTYRAGFFLLGKVVSLVAKSGMKPCDGTPQPPGRYWNPIPDDKMTIVLSKLSSGKYRYACL